MPQPALTMQTGALRTSVAEPDAAAQAAAVATHIAVAIAPARGSLLDRVVKPVDAAKYKEEGKYDRAES